MRGNPQSLPYRPAVGIMLLDGRGKVFVGRRIDQTVEAWQMPQGGIDEGETPEQAARRELWEEVGTRKAEIIRESKGWFDYDLPPHLVGVALHGRYRGQKQKWFALRFTGKDSDINLKKHTPEFAAWRWVMMAELPGLIVPFKRALYEQVVAEFRDLADVPA
jgi:putative (di)nucleoside polyphosphate hydrolase